MFTTFVVATLWLHLWSHCRYFDFISKPVSLTYFQFTLLYVANYNFLRYETIACYLFSYSWATPNWLLIIWHYDTMCNLLSFEMIMSRIWVSNLGLSSSWCRRFLFVFWKICILVLQRRNNSTQGRRRLNGRSLKAQREDSVRRTVYVSDIDQHVSELRMAWIKAYVDIVFNIQLWLYKTELFIHHLLVF
jgi:hypothetical protein